MAKPTQSIFPIENGKLTTDIDANGFAIHNLDVDNSEGIGTGGGGGGGNDTGTTTAILKGDGNHGFADAVADSDYASVSSVVLKEDITAHDADILAVQGDITALQVDVALKADFSDVTDALALKADDADLTSYIASNDAAVSTKAESADVTAGLALKADDADLTAYIASNDAAVALKADDAATTASLALKADASDLTSGLALKEDLLPTTASDSWILARHNAGSGSAWFFIDPLTLGTTSQSFSDGVENSTTTFTSATANFVANDVGKAITGTNIPGGTTIASRTNSTTIELSAAATATASSIPFTIVNRVEVTGGSGTVTSVSSNNLATELFTTAVSNATTTPSIQFSIPSGTGANRFWGNPSASAGAATFMSAAQARTSLGGTTVGQALLQLTNPSAISYARINADNTVTTRTTAQTLTDLGAESALTFTSPLARSTNTISIPAATISNSGYLTQSDFISFTAKPPNSRLISTTAPLTGGGNLSADLTLSIPAATDAVSGYLTAADHTAFVAKLSGTRILTTASPLLIDGGTSANLTADRTLSMPAATDALAGYLTASDHALFVAKPPNSRTISTAAPLTGGGDLSANRTIAIPKATAAVDGYLAAADFLNFQGGSPRTQTVTQATGTLTLTAGSPPLTRVVLTAQLTSPGLIIVLPSASAYTAAAGYPFLELVDVVAGGATANFPITLRRAGSDLINGNVNDLILPRGMGYLRLNSDAGIRWTTTNYSVDSFRDPSSPTKTVLIDVSQQQVGVPGVLTLAQGASTTVNPTNSGITGVVTDISAAGLVTKSRVSPTDLLPRVDDCGVAGTSLTDSPHTVPDTGANTGTIDTVRIVGMVGAPYQIIWPAAGSYNKGETVRLVDFSGTVSATTPVTVISSGTDLFSGQPSFTMEEANGQRILVSDGSGSWAISLLKTSVEPYRVIAPNGSIFTVAANAGVAKQNAHLNLLNGANELRVTGAFDGMDLEMVIVQPASGAAGTLNLPIGSKVSAGGGGVITLTATNGAIDRLRGVYDGQLSAFLWATPILNHTGQAVPNAPTVLAASAINANRIDLSWTDNSTTETGFAIERSLGVSGTGFTQITTVGPVASTGGTGTYSDTTVLSNTGYNYRVRAFNAGGYSTYSNSSGATTAAGGPTAEILEWHFNDNQAFTAVGSTIGPAGTMSQLAWSSSTQSGSGGCFAPPAGMLVTSGAVSVVGTTGTTAYTYRVAAWKNTGAHNASTSAMPITTGYPILDGTNYNHITWSAVTGADYYEVYRTVAGGTPNTLGRLTVPGVGTSIPAGTLFLDDKGLGVSGGTPSDISSSNDGSRVVANSTVNYNVNQISVSFWIKAAFAGTSTFNIVGGATTATSFRVAQQSANLQFQFPGANGLNLTATTSHSAIADSNWHHVVAEMDNSTAGNVTTGPAAAQSIRVFFDGNATPRNLTYTVTTRSGAAVFPSGAPTIGASGFAASIDDVRIYNHLLSTAEIAALFSGNAQ